MIMKNDILFYILLWFVVLLSIFFEDYILFGLRSKIGYTIGILLGTILYIVGVYCFEKGL